MTIFPQRPVTLCLAAGILGLAALPLEASVEQGGWISKDPETARQVEEWNNECLSCHTESALRNPPRDDLDLEELAHKLVDPGEFTLSNHGEMACRTCHVGGYRHYPHDTPLEGKKAETLTCNECHAQEFVRIQAQVEKSVHAENLKDEFTCNTCHNVHIAISAKRLGDAARIVEQDNNMCLACHDSDDAFFRFSDDIEPGKRRPDIDKIHAWLPNTRRHWASVRCIDCHTPVSTHRTLALSHQVQGKEHAEQNCVACHTRDSALRVRLYRFIAETDTGQMGFTNAAFLRNSYVVGATRNRYLDWLGLIMVGGTFAGVLVHGLIRVIAARYRRRQ